ncbi:MAG: di-heme oxidoredictase family protein [Chloroflexota bacterium]
MNPGSERRLWLSRRPIRWSAGWLLGLVVALSTTGVLAQSILVPTDGRMGGDLTVTSRTSRAFGSPGPMLSAEELRQFVVGDAAFEASFVAGAAPVNSGLGPQFNNASCVGCHTGDGRGQPVIGQGGRRSMALVRVSLPDGEPSAPGGAVPVPGLGTQIRDHATFGTTPDAAVRLAWETEDGAFADGTPYTLRRPRVTITMPDGAPVADHVMQSLRVAPPSFGRGLLEAVPEETLLALADPDDQNGDGISGRPNWVWNPIAGERQLGRFGLKANTATLFQQTAQAYRDDMGISSPAFPDPDGSAEIDQQTLDDVTFYLRTLAVPAMREPGPEATAGEQLFNAGGCASCHTPTLKTGPSSIASLANQTIYPFSDLLLHDMGPELADGRPDYEASGTEWRTPPLWGIGLSEAVAGGSVTFLHDGRARNLNEAILWHGGEAEAAREWFRSLPAEERAALIAFLRSI